MKVTPSFIPPAFLEKPQCPRLCGEAPTDLIFPTRSSSSSSQNLFLQSEGLKNSRPAFVLLEGSLRSKYRKGEKGRVIEVKNNVERRERESLGQKWGERERTEEEGPRKKGRQQGDYLARGGAMKHVKHAKQWRKCQLQMGTCHLPLQGLSWAAATDDLQHPPERTSGWRAEMRHSVFREKLAGQVFRELDILRSWFYELNSCISISRKTLKSFMVMTVPCD